MYPEQKLLTFALSQPWSGLLISKYRDKIKYLTLFIMRICWHSIYSPKLLYLGCTLKFVYCIYKLWVMIAWLLRGKFVNLGLISSFRFSLCLIISFVNECLIFNSPAIESIRSRGQHPCKFMGMKEIFYIRKESNSHRICLKHQYGRRDVMWIRSILTAGTDRVIGQQPVLRCKPRLYTHPTEVVFQERISFLLRQL